MYKPKLVGGWGFENELRNQDKEIFLVVDNPIHYSLIEKKLNNITVFVQVEPPSIVPQTSQYIIRNWSNYDYILTYDHEVLNCCPNAILFPFGSCWISKEFEEKEKKFEVSFLRGFKHQTEGHRLRHSVYNDINKEFFKKIESLPTNKDRENFLFSESQFTLVIENEKRPNWFTEKLIDALTTKTIPIYWGCPNIGNFFDKEGIICFNNINELQNIFNSIKSDELNFYNNKLEIINKNKELAINFENGSWFNRLNNKLEELCKK